MFSEESHLITLKVISGTSLNKLMLHEPQLALLHLQELDSTNVAQQSLDPASIFYHIEARGIEIDESGSLQQNTRVVQGYL